MLLHKNLKCLTFLKNLRPNTIKSIASICSSVTSSTSTSTQNVPMPKIEKSNESVITTVESFGQPTFATHPHIVNKNELVAGITVQEFIERRERLMYNIYKLAQDIQSETQIFNSDNHMVVVASAQKKFMSENIPYVFRQNSDFFYLTGCLEPDTVLMLTINKALDVKSILFMREKNKHSELWEGPRTGAVAAPNLFGVDEAYTTEEFSDQITERVKSEKYNLWYDQSIPDGKKVAAEIRNVLGNTTPMHPPTQVIQSMRLFKSEAEQNLMRRSCQIASEAINEVIAEGRPGQSEHHLFAMVDYKCRMKNANFLAYPPVVAAGNNATVIHYINNCQLIKSNDLVLMDAGCEYSGYTSDITRTWPITGTFTEPQKILYDVLLQVQKDLIALLLKPETDSLDHIFDLMCIKLGKYLQEVGIVTKHISNDNGYAQAGYKFCPHHVSHYLGMDVHDTPLMSRNITLAPGMAFTIEPGIYIGRDRTDVPKEFQGLGLRIEDDILITDDNKIEVLTASCLKERSDLENLFKSKQVCDVAT